MVAVVACTALLVAAEHDMLHDDSVDFAAALGEGACLLVARGQVHGFAQFPRQCVKGQRFLDEDVYPRIREMLGLPA